MLLVDQLSSRYNDSSNPTEKNVTATVGLVVHAAGERIIFLSYFLQFLLSALIHKS